MQVVMACFRHLSILTQRLKKTASNWEKKAVFGKMIMTFCVPWPPHIQGWLLCKN